MIVTLAKVKDAPEILSLQKLAYQSEAERYQDFSLPPLTQSLADINRDFETQFVIKATLNGEIIGSVRAYMEEDSCYIGRLVVHPDYQNQGVGTNLMGIIERCFPRANRYELFTGHRSNGSLHLYEKLGYSVYRQENVHDRLELVYLQKDSQVDNSHHLVDNS
jgi:ribosomal protein S18 acetylase RimI-like enzyme